MSEPTTGVLIWRECICGAWYWGAAQTEADKAHAAIGTYAELLRERDAIQDDYNALSDEHDKCPAVPEALDVERAADWLMENLPAVHRWMMVGWRDTMRDEAVVLMRQLAEYAALRSKEPMDHEAQVYGGDDRGRQVAE